MTKLIHEMSPAELEELLRKSNRKHVLNALAQLERLGYGGVMTGHGFMVLASTLLHEQGWPHEHTLSEGRFDSCG